MRRGQDFLVGANVVTGRVSDVSDGKSSVLRWRQYWPESWLLAQKQHNFHFHKVSLDFVLFRHNSARLQPDGHLYLRLLRHDMLGLFFRLLSNWVLRLLLVSGTRFQRGQTGIHHGGRACTRSFHGEVYVGRRE